MERSNILKLFLLSVSALCITFGTQAEPTVGETIFLGPFAGLGAKVHPANQSPKPVLFYGTDLGYSYVHDNKVHFLFGDSVGAPAALAPIELQSSGWNHDDAFGWVDINEYPDASKFSPDNLPVLRMGQNEGTDEASAIDPGFTSDLLKTPEAGFSNGTREFIIFFSGTNQVCATDNDCANHLQCDTGFGYSGVVPGDRLGISWACRDGQENCNSNTMDVDLEGNRTASGMCYDSTSSVYSSSLAGNISAISWRQRIGIRSLEDPRKYKSIGDWDTTKYYNATVSTVEKFVPEQEPDQQNYTAATLAKDANAAAQQKVLVWGRPGFIGVGKNSRDLGLYFGYADMPVDESSTWTMNFFTGVDSNGIPQFSDNEREAIPVDLDSTQAGNQPQEVHDITGQMSIAWVEQLNKWIMFYGGGISNSAQFGESDCGLLGNFARDECQDVDIGNGAVRMRSADNPWGPWTPPQDVFVGGDYKIPGSGQFGVGGILYHPECKEEGCAPHSDLPVFDRTKEYGYMYAPTIVEPWIVSKDDGVDVIWNVSTWNPYRVVLMRTHIRK